MLLKDRLAQPAPPSTHELLDAVASIEAVFERLREARPALLSRIKRAEDLYITHISCPKERIVRPRIRGGELVAYLIKGSAGQVYRVEPGSWQCSCPDAHRRGKGCKHSILCYAMWRAYQQPSPATPVAPVIAMESARDKKLAQRGEWVSREVVFAGLDRMGG